MQTQQLVAGGVALLIAVVSGVWFGGKPSDPEPMTIDRQATHDTAEPNDQLTVHVSGAVADPGLVELAADARVADALAGAGGALSSADLSVLNLAAPIADGQLIVVAEAGTPSRGPDQIVDGKVRINIASAEEIVSLPGIGPVLAQRIIDYRDANGLFDVAEDLLDVPGIGEAKLATLRDAIAIP